MKNSIIVYKFGIVLWMSLLVVWATIGLLLQNFLLAFVGVLINIYLINFYGWLIKVEKQSFKNIEYRTLEMDLMDCFKKRNIEVDELQVLEGATKYNVKVKR